MSDSGVNIAGFATPPTPDPNLPAPAPDTTRYEALREEATVALEDAAHRFTVRDQTFKMRPEIGAAVLLDLAVVGDKGTPQLEQLRAMRTFLDEAVDPDDQAEMHQLLRRAEPPIGFGELAKVIEAMVAGMSARPTEAP